MNYQQGSQRIEVIVRKGSSVSLADKDKLDTDEISSTGGKESQDAAVKVNRSSKRFERVQITHTIAIAKQIAQQELNFYVSTIGNKTGDSNLQDLVSRQVEQIKDPANIVSSALIGATYGVAGGIPGMLFGAVLNTISTATGIVYKYRGRENTLQYENFKQNNNVSYNRARAGINLTDGRLR